MGLDQRFAHGDQLEPDQYPVLHSISPAFMYQFIPVLEDQLVTPEYVYVPVWQRAKGSQDARSQARLLIAEWNALWEAGPARSEILKDEIPDNLAWLREAGHQHIRLVPDAGRNRYAAHCALYHLLPRRVLERFGLPLLRQGQWPILTHYASTDDALPADMDERLSRAFSFHVWPHLMGGTRPSGFSGNDPIRILSHSLDFWMPYADQVAQQRLRAFGRVPVESAAQAALLDEARATAPLGVQPERPLYGGMLWSGEADAGNAVAEMIEFADTGGNLRAIIDTVRSHREQDDFSDRWSFAKEDFERRIHRKRLKTKVTFVQLDDTVSVIGPESEVHENLLWQDFMAFLDSKEKRIVVLLRSGMTRAGRIAEELGYANHSPVSKALARIRGKALRYLDQG